MASRLGGGRGYLVIDHRNSPGTREVPGGTQLERDTWTCSHCGAIVIKNPDRTRPREVCRKCMAVVCDKCVLWCEPFQALADAVADGKFYKLAGSSLIVPGTF